MSGLSICSVEILQQVHKFLWRMLFSVSQIRVVPHAHWLVSILTYTFLIPMGTLPVIEIVTRFLVVVTASSMIAVVPKFSLMCEGCFVAVFNEILITIFNPIETYFVGCDSPGAIVVMDITVCASLEEVAGRRPRRRPQHPQRNNKTRNQNSDAENAVYFGV